MIRYREVLPELHEAGIRQPVPPRRHIADDKTVGHRVLLRELESQLRRRLRVPVPRRVPRIVSPLRHRNAVVPLEENPGRAAHRKPSGRVYVLMEQALVPAFGVHGLERLLRVRARHEHVYRIPEIPCVPVVPLLCRLPGYQYGCSRVTLPRRLGVYRLPVERGGACGLGA